MYIYLKLKVMLFKVNDLRKLERFNSLLMYFPPCESVTFLLFPPLTVSTFCSTSTFTSCLLKPGTSASITTLFKQLNLPKERHEQLNRIDEVIVFNSLQKEDVKKIVKLEIDKLCSRLVSLKYNITYEDSVIDLISEVGFDETYGARPLKRAIQDKIEDYVSEEVLKGDLKEDISYILYVENNEIKIKLIEDKQ